MVIRKESSICLTGTQKSGQEDPMTNYIIVFLINWMIFGDSALLFFVAVFSFIVMLPYFLLSSLFERKSRMGLIKIAALVVGISWLLRGGDCDV